MSLVLVSNLNIELQKSFMKYDLRMKVMVIALRPMREEEYPAFCDYFIADYSQEIAENYGHSLELAQTLARKDLLRSFPDGYKTNVHKLLCIEAESRVVGYLWHCPNEAEHSTFIYDFYVDESCRGKGYGTEALKLLEGQLVKGGIVQIKLRVAYHNKRALALYQETGFMVTGYNMSKNLRLGGII